MDCAVVLLKNFYVHDTSTYPVRFIELTKIEGFPVYMPRDARIC